MSERGLASPLKNTGQDAPVVGRFLGGEAVAFLFESENKSLGDFGLGFERAVDCWLVFLRPE